MSFWGLYGSWTNVILDLGWQCFPPSSCICSQACFMALVFHMVYFHAVIYLSYRKYFRTEIKFHCMAYRPCSIKTSHCRSSALEETGHAHLSLRGWPADPLAMAETGNGNKPRIHLLFIQMILLKLYIKIKSQSYSHHGVRSNYDQFQASEHLPKNRVLSLWLLLHQMKSNPATLVWTCLAALDHMPTYTWHPMPAFSCGSYNLGSGPYASHRVNRWMKIFCHLIMSSTELIWWLAPEKHEERKYRCLCTSFSNSGHRHGQRCPLGLHRGPKQLTKKAVGFLSTS